MERERPQDYATATPEQRAWIDGEYDGYWGQPRRVGIHDNIIWINYLRGYVAGVQARELEPSDAELDRWLRAIASDSAGGEW